MNTRQKQTHTSVKRIAIVALVMALFVVTAAPALAHPLGNFTINRYSRLTVDTDAVHLRYIVDMAEIPTQQERLRMDANKDGAIGEDEEALYIKQEVLKIQSNLHLTIEDTELAWILIDAQFDVEEGQASLPIQRLVLTMSTALPANNGPHQIDFLDNNYAQRLGWQEVIVQAGDGINLISSTVPSVDVSNELQNYPDDLLQTPPTVHEASVRFERIAGNTFSTSSIESAPAAADLNNERIVDPFAELIRIPRLGPLAMLLALIAAAGWGAAHALSPGHGKTIVGAYLVGSRGTAWHALFLGLTTTITHTAGVFLLGVITLFASRFILPEKLFPWLSVLSGLLVLGIGLYMAWRWLQSLHRSHPSRSHGQAQASHGHLHQHNYDHHTHLHGDHHHDHVHHDEHDDTYTDEQGVVYHRHGSGSWHTHDVPGADGTPVTWRSLLALGISGGLLPCPSALVVMLGAIALNRVTFGLVLIVAFSLGLASVLTGIGLVIVYASRFTERLVERLPQSGRLLQALPMVSALFITVVGVGITVQALVSALSMSLS